MGDKEEMEKVLMNHPLTNKMIEKILGEDFTDEIYETGHIAWLDEGYGEWIMGGMRAAYDLGRKKAKKQDKAYIRQSYKQGYNDAKKEIKSVLSQTRELEEL